MSQDLRKKKKEQWTTEIHNLDESPENYAEWKQIQPPKVTYGINPLFHTWKNKITEMENKLVETRSQRPDWKEGDGCAYKRTSETLVLTGMFHT